MTESSSEIQGPNAIVGDVLSVSTLSHDPDLPRYNSILNEGNIVQPRTIHIDGVLIFPSEPPANALYQLSRDLLAGTRISIQRIDHEIHTLSNRGPRARVKDRLLYTFSHRMFDDRFIEIVGKRKECFGEISMAKISSFRKHTWDVRPSITSRIGTGHSQIACKQTRKWLPSGNDKPQEWRDAKGLLIAIEDVLSLGPGSEGILITNPSIRIVEPLEQKLMDLLVTAWCARIWNQNLKSTGQFSIIIKGKNPYCKE